MPTNADLMQLALGSMEQDRRFAAMTYGEQTAARRALVSKYLQQDPRFAQLAPEAQAATIGRLVESRQPVYENQGFGAEMTALVKAYEQERLQVEEQKAQLGALAAMPRYRQPSPATNALKTFVATGEAAASMNLGRFVQQRIADPLMKALGIESNTSEILWGQDRRKAQEYMKGLLQRYEGAGTAGAVAGLGTVGGTVLNLAAYGVGARITPGAGAVNAAGKVIAATRPTALFNATVTAAVESLIKGIGPVGRLARGAIQFAGTQAVRSVGAGVVGAIDEVLKSTNEGNVVALENVASNFGKYAAADFVWSMAITALPAIKTVGTLLGRSFAGRGPAYGSLLNDYSKVDLQTFQDALRQYQRGGIVDSASLDRLPTVLQDKIYQSQRIFDFMRADKVELGQVDPITKTMLAANNVNFAVRVLPDGTYRLTDFMRPTFQEIHPSILSANLRIRDEFVQQVGAVAAARKVPVSEVLAGEASNPWWTQAFDNAPDSVAQLYGKTALQADPHIQTTAMRAALERENYVAVWRRGAVNQNELESLRPYLNTKAAFVQDGAVTISETQWRRLDKQLVPFSNLDDVRLRPANIDPPAGFTSKPAVAVAQRVAPLEEVQAAGQRAERLLARTELGLPESPTNLQRYLLMEKGFDAAQQADGSVQLFYPKAQVKIIDNRISARTGRFTASSIRKLNAEYSDTGLTALMRVELGAVSTKPVDARLAAGVLGRMSSKSVAADDVKDFAQLYVRNLAGFEDARVNVITDPTLSYGKRAVIQEAKELSSTELLKLRAANSRVTARLQKDIEQEIQRLTGRPVPGGAGVLTREQASQAPSVQKLRQALAKQEQTYATQALGQEARLSGTRAFAVVEQRPPVSGQPPRVIVHVPKDITKPSNRRRFVEDLVSGLNGLSEGKPSTAMQDSFGRPAAASLLTPRQAAQVYTTSVSRYSMPEGFSPTQQRKWVRDILQTRGGSLRKSGDQYVVRLGSSGGEQTFKTWEEAFDYTLKASVTEKQMEVALAEQGYRLKAMAEAGSRTRTGYAVVGPGGKYVQGWEGRSILDIIETSGIRPKLDSSVAPRLAVIGHQADQLVYDSGVITGGERKLANFLDNFEDWREREFARVFHETDATLIQKSPVRIEAYVPQIGARETFESLEDARAWAQSLKTTDGMYRLAGRRGFDMKLTAEGWTLAGQGLESNFKSLDEVGTFLSKYSDPGFAPKLLEPNIDESLTEVLDFLKVKTTSTRMPKFWRHPSDGEGVYRAGVAKVNAFLQPRRVSLQHSLHSLGMDEAMATWRDLDKSATLWKFEAQRGEHIINRMFKELNESATPGPLSRGRITDSDRMLRRMTLADYLEVKGNPLQGISQEQARQAFLKTHGLEQDQVFLRTADTVRDYYDTMMMRFGIDARKWREDYLPHIQSYISKAEAGRVNALTEMDPEAALNEIFRGKYVPKEIRWWAEHERTSDFLRDFMDRDPLSQMLRYNSQGLKKLYVNPAWSEMANVLNKGQVPSDVSISLKQYFAQLNGVDHTDVEKLISDFQAKYAKEMGRAGKHIEQRYGRLLAQHGQDPGFRSGVLPDELKALAERDKRVEGQLISQRYRVAQGGTLAKLFTLNYGAFMGWRPWVTIRNMLQVETTLAMRVGTGYVQKAVADVWEHGDEIVDLLRAKGHILDTPPIVGDIIREEGRLGPLLRGVTEHGLQGLKNSDDWSRAVAWRAAEIKLQEGLAKRASGQLQTFEEVLHYADADLMAPDVFKRTLGLLESGNVPAAMDVYGGEMINATMFVYRQTDSPIWKRGVIGKIFGQYSTYPLNYVANITDVAGATYAPVWKRVGAIARLATNSLAIYGALKAMGVDAPDFLPWNPATFAGGPNFWLFNSALASFDKGYRGRQARSELLRMVPLNILEMRQQAVRGQPVTPKPQFPWGVVPGQYQLMSIADSLKLIDEGKPVQAFWRLLSAPIVNDEASRE